MLTFSGNLLSANPQPINLGKKMSAGLDGPREDCWFNCGQNLVPNQKVSSTGIRHKDIHGIAMKEEVRETLEKQFDLIGLYELSLKILRKAYDGTQTAIISLPMEVAVNASSGESKNWLVYMVAVSVRHLGVINTNRICGRYKATLTTVRRRKQSARKIWL